MKGFLSRNQIEYVLFHFGLTVELDAEVREKFLFCKEVREIAAYSGRVIFLLREEEFKLEQVRKVNGLDVLFPDPAFAAEYEMKGDNLVFYHDYLKSSFYLLSAYQEYKSVFKDRLGRYDYFHSVQHKLGITKIPMVNYYFDTLYKGLQAFFAAQNRRLEKRDLFRSFGLMLTHDVDRVKLYNINNFIYCGKALLGLTGNDTSYVYRLASFIDSLTGFFKCTDPHWSFPFLRETEKENGFRSVYFFLDRLPDQRNYQITSENIQALIASLEADGCEIGVHGTLESVSSRKEALSIKKKLQAVVKNTVIGNRNHTLLFHVPASMSLLKELDYRYDSTLGFAHHEGFRNSFCHPFKLYDFGNDMMVDLWEIPLTLMDCTLFDYRKLDFIRAMQCVEDLINETRKFHGVFTLLWHNSYFEERKYPGITQFYSRLLSRFKENDVVSLTGREIVSLLP
ncbi:MAG: polysaccharide deacetylase family protein [Bacteroidales bacterium]|nr:polysaccharide deacetylase family protein [Bacteroidales bacterium]MBN2761982.1 polysaccharide deacetylase family protein [Bacteroidales bacterium]